MSVPPLRLCNQFEPYISGEVNVHPSAVIAPGVILQAAPKGKIVIGPGVCIGMGSVLKVLEGTLAIGEGANIGSGFLMIGAGKIGENTCVGSATTVFNCSIDSGLVIAPGSVIGDRSRKVCIEEEIIDSTSFHSQETVESQSSFDKQTIDDKVELKKSETNLLSRSSTFTSTKQYFRTNSQSSQSSSSNEFDGGVSNDPEIASEQEKLDSSDEQVKDLESLDKATSDGLETQESSSSTGNSDLGVDIGTHIYGRGNIERLLVTLFPHRQSLNQESENE